MSTNKYKNAVAWERDANTLLVGPTSSGKTSVLKDILLHGSFIPTLPKHVYIVVPQSSATSTWNAAATEQPVYPQKTTKPFIEELKERFPATLIIGSEKLDNFLAHGDETPESSIVIFDDYMNVLERAQQRRALTDWFYKITHHRHLWTFFVTHNMFTPGILPIRRNTQNFVLFDALRSDRTSAQQFVTRLLGSVPGGMFLQLWEYALSQSEKGWIRLDQRLRGDVDWRTIVSMLGITLETVWFGARSGADGLLHLDVTSPASAPDNPKTVAPTSTRDEDASTSGAPPATSVPTDGTTDLQQSDGYQPVSPEY